MTSQNDKNTALVEPLLESINNKIHMRIKCTYNPLLAPDMSRSLCTVWNSYLNIFFAWVRKKNN